MEHQGILHLNGKRFLFLPKDERLYIKKCYIDGIICNRKDFEINKHIMDKFNIGIEKEIIKIFLDDFDFPLNLT
jgi:hypothetical protein